MTPADTVASICSIRYRYDDPGPAVLIVEVDGTLRVYGRGTLSAPLSERALAAMLAGPMTRWVAAAGEIALAGTQPSLWQPLPDPDIDLSDTA